MSLFHQIREGQSRIPIFTPSWYPGTTVGSVMPFIGLSDYNSNVYDLHVLQGYDAEFLKIYPDLPPTPLQLEEDLEQLKVLENGYKLKVVFLSLTLCFLP